MDTSSSKALFALCQMLFVLQKNLSTRSHISGSGSGGPDPAFPPLFRENPASRSPGWFALAAKTGGSWRFPAFPTDTQTWIPHPIPNFWWVPLPGEQSNPGSRQYIYRFPDSRTVFWSNPESRKYPSRPWYILVWTISSLANRQNFKEAVQNVWRATMFGQATKSPVFWQAQPILRRVILFREHYPKKPLWGGNNKVCIKVPLNEVSYYTKKFTCLTCEQG